MFDQTLQEPALLGRQLTVPHADVSQEDHVEPRQLVPPGREALDVVLIAAAGLGQLRMKQQARQLDARVAREGISQVTVFPPWVRLDDQHPELLLANRDGCTQFVVIGDRFVAMLGNRQSQAEVAGCLGLPDQPIVGAGHGGDTHFFRHFVAVGGAQSDRRREVSRQRAVDRKRDPHRFAGHAEGRDVQAQQLDVGQPRAAAHRDGEDGHSPHPQSRGREHRRRSFVPITVGGQHNPAQVRDPLGSIAERLVQVCAVARLRLRERRDDDVHPLAKLVPCGKKGQRLDGFLASHDVSGCPLLAPRGVARIHAGRGVPEHGDRGLFVRAKLLDPFGLVEQHGCECDQGKPEQFEQAHRPEITAAPPGDETEHGGAQDDDDRQADRPGRSQKRE